MANTVVVDETVRVSVTFHDWGSGSTSVIDPQSVAVDILDSTEQRTVAVETAVRESPGVWYYDWTPTSLGRFYIEFKGFFADGQTSLVREDLDVVTYQAPISTTTETLEQDYEFTFFTSLSPLYVDPEELLLVYPDATIAEATEAVVRFSLEVQSLLANPQDQPPPRAVEYVRAASLCTLARVHDAAMSGMETTFTLGDLTVKNGSSSRGSVAGSGLGNWCEQAAALRKEMLRTAGTAGMRAVLKGANYRNPIPHRYIRDKEHRVQR